jgi:Tfp pilus assembly protein PilN
MEKRRISDLETNISFITKLKEENQTMKQRQANYDQALSKVRVHLTEFNLIKT